MADVISDVQPNDSILPGKGDPACTPFGGSEKGCQHQFRMLVGVTVRVGSKLEYTKFRLYTAPSSNRRRVANGCLLI